MKKRLFVIVTLLMCFFTCQLPLFAEDTLGMRVALIEQLVKKDAYKTINKTIDLIKKLVKEDADNNKLIFISYGGNDDSFHEHYLYKDNKGILYLYLGRPLPGNEMHLYEMNNLVSKEEVSENIKKSQESQKVIEKDGYKVYRIEMSGFEKGNLKYYVKTPDGKFYTVTNFIKRIKLNGADDLINEL